MFDHAGELHHFLAIVDGDSQLGQMMNALRVEAVCSETGIAVAVESDQLADLISPTLRLGVRRVPGREVIPIRDWADFVDQRERVAQIVGV